MYKILFSKYALKDASKAKKAGLSEKCQDLIKLLSLDPFAPFPPYEKLVGDLKGFYSRRINIQHRLIYTINSEEKIVTILRMWSHYE